MIRVFTGSVSKGRYFDRFLDKIPNISDDLKVYPRIQFQGPGGLIYGYPAELIVKIARAGSVAKD